MKSNVLLLSAIWTEFRREKHIGVYLIENYNFVVCQIGFAVGRYAKNFYSGIKIWKF